MPRHFEGMVDERTNLPKSRYKHKTAPEVKDVPELEGLRRRRSSKLRLVLHESQSLRS
jgi:homoserine trans-succinylase